MAPQKALDQLALQKRLLLAESEAHRIVIASAFHQASTPLRWVDRIQAQARPFIKMGVPLAGFLLMRRKGMGRWVSAGLSAVKIARKARKLLSR